MSGILLQEFSKGKKLAKNNSLTFLRKKNQKVMPVELEITPGKNPLIWGSI